MLKSLPLHGSHVSFLFITIWLSFCNNVTENILNSGFVTLLHEVLMRYAEELGKEAGFIE